MQAVQVTVPSRHGRRSGALADPDWRRTVTRWARTEAADPRFRRRRSPRRLAPVVMLWDVSGSMATYVPHYWPWVYRLVETGAGRIGVFMFGTGLDEVTPAFELPPHLAKRALEAQMTTYGSGTAIGDSLALWIQQYGGDWIRPRTTVVIISDGWDTGSPERLEGALRTLRAQVARIIWINPLKATPGFEPKTRALKVAQHYWSRLTAGMRPSQLIAISRELGFH